jgi:hypothetical protein
VAATSLLGTRGATAVWVLLWAGAAVEMVLPANRSHDAVAAMVSMMGAGEPGWLASVNVSVGSAVTGHGEAVAIGWGVGFALIVLVPLLPVRAARTLLVIAAVGALGIWVVGEDFGELFTGTATDPNTGPLLCLLAAAYWPTAVGSRFSSEHPGGGRREQGHRRPGADGECRDRGREVRGWGDDRLVGHALRRSALSRRHDERGLPAHRVAAEQAAG